MAGYDFLADLIVLEVAQLGPDALGGVSSARCPNEENYLMQKFFRVQVGTNNIDACARVYTS